MDRYDPNNLCAKILRGEVSANIAYESKHALAFHDLYPRAPVHVLVIPRGPYRCADIFFRHAPDEEVVDFFRTTSHVIRLLGIEETGYRLISNTGPHAGQEVMHYHLHVLGGAPLGEMKPDPIGQKFPGA